MKFSVQGFVEKKNLSRLICRLICLLKYISFMTIYDIFPDKSTYIFSCTNWEETE